MEKLISLILLTSIYLSGQSREILFDGKTLTGWHTQGPGTWTVEEGRIHALNPTKNWGHLIFQNQYSNAYIRLKFLNMEGNSGLYIRGSESIKYGFKGLQIDFGGKQDGSAMLVNDTNYTWLTPTSKATDSGYIKKNQWNEIAIDAQGKDVKTYINGKLIWSGKNIDGLPSTGLLALQVHSGASNDIYFKDIEALLPTRIPYCPDTKNINYRPGNDPDSSLCKPLSLYSQKYLQHTIPNKMNFNSSKSSILISNPNFHYFNSLGSKYRGVYSHD